MKDESEMKEQLIQDLEKSFAGDGPETTYSSRKKKPQAEWGTLPQREFLVAPLPLTELIVESKWAEGWMICEVWKCTWQKMELQKAFQELQEAMTNKSMFWPPETPLAKGITTNRDLHDSTIRIEDLDTDSAAKMIHSIMWHQPSASSSFHDEPSIY